MLVVKGYGQAHQAVKRLLAHAVNDAAADMDHQQRQAVGQHRAGRVAGEHQQTLFDDDIPEDATACVDGVNCFTGQLRAEQAEHVAGKGQHERQQKQRARVHHRFKQAQDGALGVARLAALFGLLRLSVHYSSPPICESYSSR